MPLFAFVLASYLLFFSFPVVAVEEISKEPVLPGECSAAEMTRQFQLKNGLKVIILTDTDAKTSSVALDVQAGYRDDPADIPGMAHFLEHMLFLGTEDRPEPHSYRTFFSSNGGDSNATTRYDSTTYYYTIDPDAFFESLDIFSNQFTRPLLSPLYVGKEKMAINAEFQYRKDGTYRQVFDVAKNAFFMPHPIQKFGIGNLESLSKYDDEELAKRMRQWWQEHYSADKMSLVIHSSYTPDEIETRVRKLFSAIPQNTQDVGPDSTTLEYQKELPLLAKAHLDDEERAMVLLFPVPKIESDLDLSAYSFIEFMLERRLPQSFVNNVQGRRFAGNVHVDTLKEYSDTPLLEIYIDLYYYGGEKYWQVVQQLMLYVEKLRNEPLEQWRVDEFNLTEALEWCFSNNRNISLAARNLNKFGYEHVYSANKVAKEYDAASYKAILDSITVENMMAVVAHPHFSGNKETPWYRIEYEVDQISSSTQKNYYPNGEITHLIERPEQNPYLPSKIMEITKAEKGAIRALDIARNIESWHQYDTELIDPKAYFFIELTSPLVESSRKNSSLITLLESFLNEQLKYAKATARDANSEIEIVRVKHGLEIRFEGYAEGIDAMLDVVLDKLGNFRLRKDRFINYRYGWVEYLKDFETIHPLTQAEDLKGNLLAGPHLSYGEQQAGMRASQETALRVLLKEWKNNISLKTLVYGNVDESLAKSWNIKVKNALVTSETDTTAVQEVARLPFGISRIISESEFDDSVVDIYVQGWNSSFEEKSRFYLAEALIAERFFSELRTEQQAGYVTNAEFQRFRHVPGLNFYIQSPYQSAEKIESEIVNYLIDFTDDLSALTDSDFQKQVAVLQVQFEKPADNLSTEAYRKWRSIRHENKDFDYRNKIAESLSKITKTDFIEWYKTRFVNYRRLLSVLVEGTSHSLPWGWEFKNSDTIIDDFEDFVDEHGYL